MAINFNPVSFDLMIDNFAKTLTYTPVTTRVSNSGGDEEFIEGTSSQITGAFFKRENIIDPSFEGLFKDADAIVLTKRTETPLTRNSFITFDGEKFQVRLDMIKRYLGSTNFYYMTRLYKYNG